MGVPLEWAGGALQAGSSPDRPRAGEVGRGRRSFKGSAYVRSDGVGTPPPNPVAPRPRRSRLVGPLRPFQNREATTAATVAGVGPAPARRADRPRPTPGPAARRAGREPRPGWADRQR